MFYEFGLIDDPDHCHMGSSCLVSLANAHYVVEVPALTNVA